MACTVSGFLHGWDERGNFYPECFSLTKESLRKSHMLYLHQTLHLFNTIHPQPLFGVKVFFCKEKNETNEFVLLCRLRNDREHRNCLNAI